MSETATALIKQTLENSQKAAILPGIEERLINMTQLEAILSRKKSSIYSMIKDGTFPPGYLSGPKSRVWRLSEVMTWIDNLPKAN